MGSIKKAESEKDEGGIELNSVFSLNSAFEKLWDYSAFGTLNCLLKSIHTFATPTFDRNSPH